jgi:hypothetical protein
LHFDFSEITPPLGSPTTVNLLATIYPEAPIAHAPNVIEKDLAILLPRLGVSAAKLLEANENNLELSKISLSDYIKDYLCVLTATGIPFSRVLEKNLEKIESRFLLPENSRLPIFDNDFDEDEQLPRNFSIDITQRQNGKTYLKWNNVFIGDPLTDNVIEEDGYRFHDIFHMANAAILGWSPTFRALIRHKRKSSPQHDEVEDGGRAIVIEEGLTAWIFSQAKQANFFEGRQSISFDLLKRIKHFVSGFEVEACPVSLWEKCILDSYSAFRKIREAKCGRIIGNLENRTISFEPLS